GPRLTGRRSTDEVLAVVEATAKEAGAGEPLTFYDAWLGDFSPRLSRVALDRVAPRNPVAILDRGGHAIVVNTRGFEAAKLDGGLRGVLIGQNGEAQGELVAEANAAARWSFGQFVTDERRRRAHEVAAAQALEVGLTTVHALEGGEGGSGVPSPFTK